MPHQEGVDRLRVLYEDLVSRYGALVTAEEDDEGWTVEPTRPGAVGVTWYYSDEFDVNFQVLTAAEQGGRWELWNATAETIDLLEDMVWSVAAGRVEETFGAGISTLRITLTDGSVVQESGGALASVFSRAGRRQRGQLQRYLPWADHRER